MRSRVERAVVWAAAVLAAVVLLGPALAPGYVLLRDMVFVPRLPLTPAAFGLSSALPRAVPQDAVVALLSVVAPGEVLQKVALVSVVVVGFVGAATVLEGCGTLVRLVSGTTYVWSAYVVERLLLGHWSLLLAYAALPWFVVLARRRRPWWAYAGPLALGALTPTGSLLTGVAAVTCAATVGGRTAVRTAAVAGALTLPWLVPTLTTPTSAGSSAAGFEVFAARAETAVGWFGALLGLGGVWNAQAVPASRGTAVAPVVTLVVLVVAALGIPELRRLLGERLAAALGGLALLGLVLASTGPVAVALGVADGLAAVPGSGLLRDGQKWVAWCAVPLAACFALGAGRLGRRAAAAGLPRRLVVVAALCLPVAAMPDAVWGVLGRLAPTDYPADWPRVAAAVAAGPADVRVASLPWSTFRAPPWNDDRPVLDPLPRWLDRRVVADDRLVVDGTAVPGEDPLSDDVAQALRRDEPLTGLGVGWVVVAGPPGAAEPPAGTEGFELALAGPSLQLWRALDPVNRAPEPGPPTAAVVAGWLVAAGALVAAAGAAVRSHVPRRVVAGGDGTGRSAARVRPE